MPAADIIDAPFSSRFLLLFVLAIVIVLALTAVARAGTRKQERTRDDVQTAIAAAEQSLTNAPADPGVRRHLARLLFESGEFHRADALIEPAANKADAAAGEILLAAELKYLLGRYADAEAFYRRLLAHDGADKSTRLRAKVGLGFTCYQTNQFDRFRELDFGRGVEFPADKLIRSFNAPPYQVKWHGDARKCEVPFLTTDPLPVFTVHYDGRPVNVLFDTGADMCILDSELAAAWGVKEQASTVGGFGGGKLGRVGFGKLSSVTLGPVTLGEVPVLIMPTKRFSSIFPEKLRPLGGIVGTGLIRQFLTTIDYRQGRIVLRERTPAAQCALRTELDRRVVAEVPFVLTGTHWMMARGSLDGRDGLTFFVDSGLAADAAFSAPPQTLRYAGIPEPEQKVDPDSAGGGGGSWASGRFAIKSLGLGPLRQSNLAGEFGAMPASSYWQSGFIQDGLISHRFLRQYSSWTIDFDAMQYLFVRDAER